MADLSLNITASTNSAQQSVEALARSIRELTGGVKKATAEVGKIGGETRAASAHISRLGNSAKKASGMFGKLTKSLGRIAFYRAIRSAIRYVTEGFKEGLEAAYNWSKLNPEHAQLAGAMDKLRDSAGKMKLQLGAAFGGLIVAIEPVLTKLIQLVTDAAEAVTRFFAILNGNGWYKKAVGGLEQTGNAAGGAGKQIKGLLASWDELNVIGKESGGGGSGSSSNSWTGDYEWVEAEGGIAQQIRDAFLDANWEDLGRLFGESINSIFSTERFESIGKNIGKQINALFTTTYWTLDTINFENIGASIASLLNGAISQIDFSNLGGIIADGLLAIPGMIVGFVETLDFGAVGNALNETIHGFITNITEFVAETDWGDFVWSAITGIFDFISGLDIPSIALDLLGFLGTVIGAVAEGLGDLMIEIGEVVTNPDTWTLVGAWLKDLPARLKNFGIKAVNGFVQPIIDGINDIINKYNGSAMADLFGEIEPITFNLIPEIPDEELNKNYNKAKAEIEARSKENPTVFDSTANYTDWSVGGSKDKSKVSHFTTWNSTAQWNAQKIGPKWAGTTWNSTAFFKSYEVDSNLKSNGYMRISATADIKSVTGSSVNITAAANGGLFKNGAWRPITSYASGGSPFGGQIFRARENGNPELVGTINGSTAVMNNGQIVASVSAGVARAISNIRFKMVGFGGASISSTPMDNEQIAQNIQNGIERGNEEQNDLLREQNNILLRLLQNGIQLNPSVALGQVVARSTDLYARA